MTEATMRPETVLFEEVQRTSPATALFTLLAGGGAIAFGGFLAASRGELSGALPGLVFGGVVMAGVSAAILLTRLYSRVTTAEAVFRYGVFGTVRLRGDELEGVSMKRFGLFDGGIGYHVSRRSVAITARTGDGVLIQRAGGRRALIGTQHPDALYSALLQLQASARKA